MKEMNLLEKVGFIIIIIGLVVMLLKVFTDDYPQLEPLVEHYDLFYWSGMLLWALGNIYRGQEKKKAEQEE